MATVTIPVKDNINRSAGTLALRLSHTENKPDRETLIQIGDFTLAYEEGFLLLNNKESSASLPTALFPGEATIIWTWIGDTHRLIVTRDDELEIDELTFDEMALTGGFGELINLVSTPHFTGAYQELIVFAEDFVFEEARAYTVTLFMDTADRLFHANFREPMHYKKEPVIETTFAPTDGSPILVQDELGLLNRQYFFDYHTGEYTSDNTEEFTYKGEETLYIAYDNLNPHYDTIVTFEEGEVFIAKHVTKSEVERLKANQTTGQVVVAQDAVHFLFSDEEREQWWGQVVTIRYQINRSYNVEYNEKTAHDSLRIQLNNHQSHPIEVIQEGNRFSNVKLGREVDLNPLVNPRHTGFLYIDKEEQHTQAFRLNLSNAYVLADGMDSADFIVEAIDEEGNEVLSPYLDVFLMDDKGRRTDELGSLTPVVHYDTMKARNMSGRCYYKYHAPLITTDDYPVTQKVFAVALDRRSNIGTQIPLYIRPVEAIQDEIKQTRLVSQSASLVFEYIARYFERELPAGHPLEQLDQDQDGKIDRRDFTYFDTVKYNDSLMQNIDTALRLEEG